MRKEITGVNTDYSQLEDGDGRGSKKGDLVSVNGLKSKVLITNKAKEKNSNMRSKKSLASVKKVKIENSYDSEIEKDDENENDQESLKKEEKIKEENDSKKAKGENNFKNSVKLLNVDRHRNKFRY